MKKPSSIICTLLFAVSLAACSTPAAQPQPGDTDHAPKQERPQVQTPPPPSASEIKENTGSSLFVPLDAKNMKEPVMIVLNEEQRLQAPIATVVAPSPQTYTLYFKEPMDRASVEQTLKLNAEKWASADGRGGITPQLAHVWKSDKLLELTVTVPAAKELYFGNRSYLLNLAGAKTASGSVIAEDTPSFQAVLYAPPQIWRISTDGKQKEKLFAFEKPYYSIKAIDRESRYLLLSRFKEYCECDADYERLYALFDREQKKLTSYPVELATDYIGPGAFVADTRGFFYKQPADGMLIPQSDTAIPIQIKEYIYGANLSRDRQYLFMAVGREEQTGDFDLVIRHLPTGKEERMAKALQGVGPKSELNGQPLPVTFHDDGKQVTFSMRKETEYAEIRYRYDWRSKQITPWQAPIPQDAYSGYSSSDDGTYQLYRSGGLFRGEQLIQENLWEGYWIPGTHRFVYIEFDQQGPDSSNYKQQLKLYDADRKTSTLLASKLFMHTNIIGISADGKWVYIQSHDELNQPMGE